MRKFNSIAVVLSLFMAACGGSPSTGPQEPVEPQAGEGVVELPLVWPGPQGEPYRLVGAVFNITGPKAVTLTDDSPAAFVSATLPAGTYTIQLSPGWSMERMGQTVETVQATLISPNPMAFTVLEGQRRTVRFLFKVPGNGTTDVGFTVDTGGWIAGTFEFPPLDGPGTGSPFDVLAGTSVPFVMSFAEVNVNRSSGPGSRATTFFVSPITLQFGGEYSELLHDRIAPSFEYSGTGFALQGESSGSITFSGFQLYGMQGENFALEFLASPPFAGVLDAEGYPEARPFQFVSSFRLSKGGSPYTPVMGTVRASVTPR